MADASSIAGYIKDRYRGLFFYYSKNIYYNSGNVGIGTTNPQQKLDIQGTNPTIRLLDTNTDGNAIIMFRETNDLYGMDIAYIGNLDNKMYIRAFNNSATAVNHLTIDRATGNVGIGTNNPAGKLDINSGFVYIDGFKQPFSRTGTVSGTTNIDIPLLFDLATTTVHTCEIVIFWQIQGADSPKPNLSIYELIGSTQYNPSNETGYKENVYNTTTITGGVGNILATIIEIGYSCSTKIRIGKSLTNITQYRNHYVIETIYCKANVGTTQNISIGWFTVSGITHVRLLLNNTQTFNNSSWTATYYHV